MSAAIDIAELRDAAENDGESATTVYIGGAPWPVVLALIEVVETLHDFERRTILGLDPSQSKLWDSLDPFVFADSYEQEQKP